ncbi:Hsp20/alpha crystallin family protein [Rufibacter latericius]|uniref:Hsp20/alpha crystallin family protein n=1 Tax=Rufibacter latericius TaxID=2487040 RepID=A0A3M9MDE4_9BACT|nr:Hsp20/alpha crystallin family protein [Rufibacter latericius]RNI23591.1 Hsp20/alpha crystallin family protein [Rufibacter latericius]
MKLIKDKKFLKNIAHYIDLTNTIGGGVVQPQVNMVKRKTEAVLQVVLPGVSPEQCQVLLDKNQLTVMALHQPQQHPETQMPLFHQNFLLPPYVDFSELKVVHKGHELRVHIPYLPQGPRFLEIEQR